MTDVLFFLCLLGIPIALFLFFQYLHQREIDRAIRRVYRTASRSPEICQGCRNHHGASYQGNYFVCAMHPYGNGDECPDFKAFDAATIQKRAKDTHFLMDFGLSAEAAAAALDSRNFLHITAEDLDNLREWARPSRGSDN